MEHRNGNNEKDFYIVDKSTGEIVGETNNKRSGAKSALLTILGTVLGFAAFYIAFRVSAWIVAFVGSIPILGRLVYYPSDAPWASIALPPPVGVFAGAAVCAKISGRAAPVCVAIIAVYLLCVAILLFCHALSLDTGLVALFTIGSAAVAYSMKAKDLDT